jgi:hypothetical protein
LHALFEVPGVYKHDGLISFLFYLAFIKNGNVKPALTSCRFITFTFFLGCPLVKYIKALMNVKDKAISIIGLEGL